MSKLKHPKQSGTPATDDNRLHVAETAFNRRKAELDAIPLSGLEPLRIDLQAAAVQAIGVAQTLSEPALRQHIKSIAQTGVIDIALLDGLEEVAWATWFARHKLLLAGATHSEAALPAALVERASALRGRMLKTLAYHLEDDAEATARIAHLRAGSGHLDLANDLAAAAEMYRAHHESIKDDKKNFHAADAKDASELAEQILRLLGATTTPEQTLWKGYQARAAKLLLRHYDEAVRVGRFLFYYDEAEARFPSLFTASRAAPAPRDKKANNGVPNPPSPGTEPQA